MESHFLKVGDVAKSLGVSDQTIRNWESKGILKSVRTPGGHRRFREMEVEALRQKIETSGITFG